MSEGRKHPDRRRLDDAPDERLVTERQAAYLARETGLESEKLTRRPLGELHELLKWRVDPTLLLYRKVCGRVVRVDPSTGVVQGVPNATVHVEDTDCTFLGFFPVEGPWTLWWWLWPISCQREEIATTVTDECGRFCVWIPRWDIDRILRWRLERHCYPQIFRPSLADLLDRLREPVERPPFPVDPNPPDPSPFDIDRGVLDQVSALVGRPVLDRLAPTLTARSFGSHTGELREALAEPAFLRPFPAPLDDAALKRLEGVEMPALDEAEARSALGQFELEPSRAIGPFLRCENVLVPEWDYVFDVPDITFRVTQDVDLDGDEEEIYSESHFDVRWNAGAIPPVILHASGNARPSPICEGPSIPCGDEPAIVTVGLMPLAASHHDNATGRATRVNRPRPGGLYSDPQVTPGHAPYAGTLQLHGCNAIGGAAFYRLLYAYNGASEVPFTGLEWYAPRLTGPPWWVHVAADSSGWYPVPPDPDELVFPNWLLNWPTTSYPNGEYVVRMQLADGAKNPLTPPAEFSDPVRFRVDNSHPIVTFAQLRWRVEGGAWDPANTFLWPFTCIVIERPKKQTIEIEIDWGVSATHLRDANIAGSGCGSGNPQPVLPLSDQQHWHEHAADNSVARTTRFTVDALASQGAYSFGVDAWSRAFNPAGDGGGPATNWLADYSYLRSNPVVAVAIIDA